MLVSKKIASINNNEISYGIGFIYITETTQSIFYLQNSFFTIAGASSIILETKLIYLQTIFI